ncbi:aldo/keto reductase, partial [Vibrio parahaemolyticus]
QTIQAFGDLIRQGKVREWALSNVRAWHIPHVWHLCRQLGTPVPVALQPYYNLMNRQPEVDVLPAAKAFDLGVVPY